MSHHSCLQEEQAGGRDTLDRTWEGEDSEAPSSDFHSNRSFFQNHSCFGEAKLGLYENANSRQKTIVSMEVSIQ